MHEGVWLQNNNFDKMTALRTLTIFPIYHGFCTCMDSAFMGQSTPTIALMEKLDTLPIRCRHIELMLKEFGLEKIFFL